MWTWLSKILQPTEARGNMGEVSDSVKGSGKSRKKTQAAQKPGDRPTDIAGAENILEEVRGLKDELSELIAKKDEDAGNEGDDALAVNVRKAGTLRACHSLLTSVQTLLEEY